MIPFSKFCERLATGQLKNTHAVDDKSSLQEIVADQLPVILNLTNEGLTDLSTRMPIVTKLVDLTFQSGKTLYSFDDTGLGDYLDVTETGDTFVGADFVRVLNVYDSEGKNHPHDTNGHIITPSYSTLRFTLAKMEDLGEKVRIRWQSKHAEIGMDDSIDLPPNLLTGLQLFVASLFISHMNGEDHSAKGDSYFAAYLRHIGEDELRNLSQTSEVEEDTRLMDRGFV